MIYLKTSLFVQPSSRVVRTALLATALVVSLLSTRAAPADPAAGNWRGAINAGGVKLRLVFKINQSASGELSGKMDSLDQGARDIPVDRVTKNGSNLRLEVNAVQGVYEGTLDKSGSRITGKWSQGGQSLALDLEKGPSQEQVAEAEILPAADVAANKLAAQKLIGTWNGTLTAGTGQLRLRVKILKDAKGAATGTMDSLDQGAKDIPLSAILLKVDELSFEARGIGGSYKGKFTEQAGTVKGDWQQGGHSLPLTLTKSK